MGCADNANAVKNTNADKSAVFNIVLIVYENSQVNVLTLPFANEVIYYLSLKNRIYALYSFVIDGFGN